MAAFFGEEKREYFKEIIIRRKMGYKTFIKTQIIPSVGL